MLKLKKSLSIVFIILITAAQFILLSCTEDISSDIPESYNSDKSLIAEGWAFYSDEEYDSSFAKFSSVVERNALATEAFIGKGWSGLKLDKYQLATTNFNLVINLAAEQNDNRSIADAYAGLFLIASTSRYDAQTDPEQEPTEDEILGMMEETVEMGENVLVFDISYSTEHDPEFSVKEVRNLLAQSYLYLHRFQKALEHVEAISTWDINVAVKSDTLAAWVNKIGEIQLFVVSDIGDIESMLLEDKGVIRVLELYDLNNNSATVKDDMLDYLYKDNLLNLRTDYDFSIQTDTLESYKIGHAQPEEASANRIVLTLGKAGVYYLESVNKVLNIEKVTWWHVDTTDTPWDTTLATGIYSKDEDCCFFYSDTTQKDTLIEVLGKIWTPLDPETSNPTDPLDTIYPEDQTLVYNYNMVYLPDEPNPGSQFIVTYKCGQYEAVYEKVDNYLEYLQDLNSRVSVSSGD